MGRWLLFVVALAGCDRVFSIERPDAAPGVWLVSDHVARKALTITPPSRTPLADFPVGVAITDAELVARARPEARDVVFTADDGLTVLDHEIESYDAGALVAWVRIPELAGTTRIYLYYGGSPMPAGAPPWAQAFGAVWHLSGEVPGVAHDSTPNANGLAAATPATQPAVIDGVAGRGRRFDGVDDGMTAPTTASLDVGDGSFSCSLWVEAATASGGYDSPLAKGGSRPQYPGYIIQLGTDPWTVSVADGVVQRQVMIGSETQYTDRWVHLATVLDRDAGELRAFVDGAQVTRLSIAPLGSAASPTSELSLSPYYDPFHGAIDEVRIVRGALPASWFEAEHANLTDPTFLVAGAEELRPDAQ